MNLVHHAGTHLLIRIRQHIVIEVDIEFIFYLIYAVSRLHQPMLNCFLQFICRADALAVHDDDAPRNADNRRIGRHRPQYDRPRTDLRMVADGKGA